MKEFEADLRYSEEHFRDDYSKMEADSRRENLELLRPDLEDFLADDMVLYNETREAYIACLKISADETVTHNCGAPQWFLRETYTHLGIEDTLEKLPYASASGLENDDVSWQKLLSTHLTRVESVSQEIATNPVDAAKYGVPVEATSALLDKARRLQSRALSIGQKGNPVLVWILLVHSDLLLSDFDFRTDKYQNMLLGSVPALR